MSVNALAPIFISQTRMSEAQKTFAKAAQSIASGKKASLNPTDLYVASKLDTTIRTAKTAIANAENGYNFTAVADSTLGNISQNLQRIRELSIQAANGIYSNDQRAAMQEEINQNVGQIQQTLQQATFNGTHVLNDTSTSPVANNVNFMVGGNSSDVVSYNPNIALGSMNFDVSTANAAANSLAQVDTMLDVVNSQRSEIGAVQTSLEGAIEFQNSNILSYTSSLSTVQDTDYVSAINDLRQSQFTMEAMAKVMKTVMNSQSYVLNLLP